VWRAELLVTVVANTHLTWPEVALLPRCSFEDAAHLLEVDKSSAEWRRRRRSVEYPHHLQQSGRVDDGICTGSNPIPSGLIHTIPGPAIIVTLKRKKRKRRLGLRLWCRRDACSTGGCRRDARTAISRFAQRLGHYQLASL
jgi:hypothetical protein